MEASRAGAHHAPARGLGGVRQVVADYVTLTKPRVQLLLLLTTVSTMYVAGDRSVALALVTRLGGALAARGAGARHHYCGRRSDAQIASGPPLPGPAGRVRPGAALA